MTVDDFLNNEPETRVALDADNQIKVEVLFFEQENVIESIQRKKCLRYKSRSLTLPQDLSRCASCSPTCFTARRTRRRFVSRSLGSRPKRY